MSFTSQNLALKFEAMDSRLKANLAHEALFKSLPVAFYWLDKKGYFLGCNDEELKIHGLSSMSDFVGRHSDEIYAHPIDKTLPLSAWSSSKLVIEKNQTMTMEEVQIKPNDEKVYYLSIKSPIHNKQGNTIGILGLSCDITARKKMEEDIRTAKERAAMTLLTQEIVKGDHQKSSTALKATLSKVKEARYYLNGKYQGLSLSKRQAECLLCLARGYTAKEIAKILGLSPRTAEHYLGNMKTKLGCQNRFDLLQVAIEWHFLEGMFQ